jgi:hypothetical protein
MGFSLTGKAPTQPQPSSAHQRSLPCPADPSAQPSHPAQPSPPAHQPQPMNWLDRVESCLQHSLGDLPLSLVSSPANKLASYE